MGNQLSSSGVVSFGAGRYPAEYNPKVHGPYNPGKWYGPRKYILVPIMTVMY